VIAYEIGGFIQDLVNKENNKGNTDYKPGIAKQVSSHICQHEIIDLVDADQHNKKRVKDPEKGNKIQNTAEHYFFNEPKNDTDY
jgi:hypothetical protein